MSAPQHRADPDCNTHPCARDARIIEAGLHGVHAMLRTRSRGLLVSGIGALVVAMALRPVLGSDWAAGAAFGAAIGLLLLAVGGSLRPGR
jgi:hypothetical protein